MKLLILLPFIMVGCASTSNWKSAYHDSAIQLDQDKAECQLLANQAAMTNTQINSSGRSKTTFHQGSFDKSTGFYTGTSTSGPSGGYLTGVTDALLKNAHFVETFDLCMKSKGYYAVEKTEKKTKIPAIASIYEGSEGGNSCQNALDCDTGFYCDAGVCCNTREAKRAKAKRKKP